MRPVGVLSAVRRACAPFRGAYANLHAPGDGAASGRRRGTSGSARGRRTVRGPVASVVRDIHALHAATHELVPAPGRLSAGRVAIHGPAVRLAALLDRPQTAAWRQLRTLS